MKRCLIPLLALSMTLGRAHGVDMCPVVEYQQSDVRVKSDDPNGPAFREISGLAFSPTQNYNNKPIFFAVSDGGGDARIGMFDSATGRRLRTLRIDRNFFGNNDWESLTIGSCGKTGESETCLYIMDVGDNNARTSGGIQGRSSYRMLKVREPNLAEYNDNDYIPTSRMARLDFDYTHPSSPTRYADCEAVFLDHVGWGSGESKGDIYVATKWDRYRERNFNRLFHIPASAWASTFDGQIRRYSPAAVGNYDYSRYQSRGGIHFMSTTWTGGEMSFDGTLIELGNNSKAYVWLRCPGQSVVDAMVNPGRDVRSCLEFGHPADGQVETFAFTPDKRYGLDIPEGNTPKMGWTKFRYDSNQSSKICPGPPTPNPTPPPTRSPTPPPTRPPTPSPTKAPSPSPTRSPTHKPSSSPSYAPTMEPTKNPTDSPTLNPTICSHEFKLSLETGEFGSTTTWALLDGDVLVAEGLGYDNNTDIEVVRCVDGGVHTFKIQNALVDGVPGRYQISYDDVVMYDSNGEYGSLSEISFTAGDGFLEPTISPTAAPVASQAFGVACEGVCPSGSLVNPDQVVVFSTGAEYRCGLLDQRYAQLFATPDACSNLALSAQEAGCSCNALKSEAEKSPQASIQLDEDDVENHANWVGLLLGFFGAIGLISWFKHKHLPSKKNGLISQALQWFRDQMSNDGVVDKDMKSFGKDHDDDSRSMVTEQSGSSTEKSTVSTEEFVIENAIARLRPGQTIDNLLDCLQGPLSESVGSDEVDDEASNEFLMSV